ASRDWFVVPAGHVAVISHGGRHELGDQPGRPAVPFEAMLEGRPLLEARHLRFETGPGGTSKVLCGFLGCDRRAFEPLCGSLPPVFQVDLGDRMQTLVPYAVANALDDSPGAAGLRGRLAELLFLGALRIYMRELPAGASGWLAGVKDPVIGRAMQAMHAQPHRRWTLDELAATAASSRSAVAARFTEVLDETPMHYLTRLRMYLAARLLTDSHKSLATIAEEVGYESPAAFQRAFKRNFDMPPAAWRRHATEATTGVA
ncbi:MAG: AraC family transcriptional regulator, partial [Burkholderiales bacterium]|nr:AraC family transcriptional regulator [Burkholderiales bacterium]